MRMRQRPALRDGKRTVTHICALPHTMLIGECQWRFTSHGSIRVIMRKVVDDVRWLIFAWIISAIVFVMIVLLWHLLMGQS
jgi:hypothetical protein